jgi:hypothetical protein
MRRRRTGSAIAKSSNSLTGFVATGLAPSRYISSHQVNDRRIVAQRGVWIVEHVLGGHTDAGRFAAFLANWEFVLARRAGQAIDAFSMLDGVCGLLLAGGLGRGAPWPLSDIDLIPIYEDESVADSRQEVERVRLAMLPPWIGEGWWTGLDIGKLAFTRSEVLRMLTLDEPTVLAALVDDRWYHSLDKAYGGRAVFDPDGLASSLAGWLTRHRFSPSIVGLRLARDRREITTALQNLRVSLDRQDLLAATAALRAAVQWRRIAMLEEWGERDASVARVGSRFDKLAAARGLGRIAETLNTLCDLDDASVDRRMAAAPWWVHERHDRSLRARQKHGESVSRIEDARDVLRVCTLYATRGHNASPLPAWLSVPTGGDELSERAAILSDLVSER